MTARITYKNGTVRLYPLERMKSVLVISHLNLMTLNDEGSSISKLEDIERIEFVRMNANIST